MAIEISKFEGEPISFPRFSIFLGTNSWPSVCLRPAKFHILIPRRSDWLTGSSAFLLSTSLSQKFLTFLLTYALNSILQIRYYIAFAGPSTSHLWKAWKWHYVLNTLQKKNSVVFCNHLHSNSYHLESIFYYLQNLHTFRNLILF